MNRGPTRSGSTLRCAVYTRKSSEEGLEQEFNSLHAQREACEAFIISQRHEGWSCLLQLYDDGGRSGGNLERPALQLLLADIRDGKVDVVVVYKIDRLTRSLADFAKIVEIFDQKGVSFVSVTQQFNTTTSMGRLTLNVLLSFAQFEREVTGERIRDKIAASKKKGMWMGGVPPLGYAVRDRKLVIVEGPESTPSCRSRCDPRMAASGREGMARRRARTAGFRSVNGPRSRLPGEGPGASANDGFQFADRTLLARLAPAAVRRIRSFTGSSLAEMVCLSKFEYRQRTFRRCLIWILRGGLRRNR